MKINQNFFFVILVILTTLLSNYSSFSQSGNEIMLGNTKYLILSDIQELEQFGYKYLGKKMVISVRFWKISNDFLSGTPDANMGRSREGGTTYFNSKKARELVGFIVGGIGPSTDLFFNSYGYQKDILVDLKSLKTDDQIMMVGEVVPWTDGDKVGFKVSKVMPATKKVKKNKNLNEPSKKENFWDRYKWYIIGAIFFGIFSAIFSSNKNEK
jgi:hypothetical protein